MIALGTRVVLVSALAMLAALAMLTAVRTAEAAFPGKNGKVAYHRAFDYFAKNPSLGSQEAKLFDSAANLTYSPDGSQIAAEYFGDIFAIPSVGGTARTILPGPDNKYPGQELDPAWSPDGMKIAFEHNGNDSGSAYDIYTANADGSSVGATQLTSKTGEIDPDWQPLPACTNSGATAGNDTINGTPGKDVLCGLGGNDIMKGLDGNDILIGGPGNDTLGGGLGNDIANGGSGADTANYSASATRISASLTTEFARGEGMDTFSGVERLTGSSLADTLTGSGGPTFSKGSGATTRQTVGPDPTTPARRMPEIR